MWFPVEPGDSHQGLAARRSNPAALVLFALLFSSAARASGGTAVGWGYNGEGAVGNGSASTTGCKCIETPAAAVGLSEVTQVSAGLSHSAALLSSGNVMAWGSNSEGQLGNGGTAESPVPVAVPGALERGGDLGWLRAQPRAALERDGDGLG